jgi:hypothetical protein
VSEDPEFLAGLAEDLDSRPLLIVARLGGDYTTRRFKRAVKKLCRHFGIPNDLTSLIGVTALHDYELAIYKQYLFLFRVDSAYAEIVTFEPAMLSATFEVESDIKIIQYV